MDQKRDLINEEFASFVRIKEVFLDEDGLEKELVLSRRWIFILALNNKKKPQNLRNYIKICQIHGVELLFVTQKIRPTLTR